MKTNTHFFNIQPLALWRSSRELLKTFGCELASSLLAVPSVTGSYYRVALNSIQNPKTTLVPVVQAVRAIPALTKALVSSATINNRFYVGLVLVSIVAPLSACIQMLPGMKELVSADWFYKNYYNLFLVLGPYFFSLCIVTAAFLWIPPITKRIKFSQKDIKFQLTRFLTIPFGYIVGKIIWLCFCTSNDDFELLPSFWCFFAGFSIGYLIIRILDYLVWRQEHAMNALIDSLEGLVKTPGFTDEERVKHSAPLFKELRQFHSKY